MPPAPASRPPAADDGSWGRGDWPPQDEAATRDERMGAHEAARARMHEILEAATRSGPVHPEDAGPIRIGPRVGRGLGGCLMRLVLLAMFLFIALMLGLFSLGGSLFPFFRIFF